MTTTHRAYPRRFSRGPVVRSGAGGNPKAGRAATRLVAGSVAAFAGFRRWLSRNSVALLRVSMGSVILGFGMLKLFPGLSPAQELVIATTEILSFGLVSPGAAMLITAALECIIGLSLITGLWLRVTMFLIAAWLVGILSPTVLLPERVFAGPGHAPTLEGQYVLKDIVLVAAILVIATRPHRQ